MKRQHNNFFVFFLYFFCFLFLGLGFRFGPLVVEAKTVVISDNFDDGVLNPDLWEIYTNLPKQQPLDVREQNGRLEFLTDGTQPDLCSGIRLKKEIPRGVKFTVSVDFGGPPRHRNATIVLAVHNTNTDQEHADQYIWAAKGGTDWYGGGKSLNDEIVENDLGIIGATTGTLRIVVVDSHARCFTDFPCCGKDIGLGNFSAFDQCFISLFVWSDSPTPLVAGEAYFENFSLTLEEPDDEPESTTSVAPADTPPVVDSVDPVPDPIIAEPVAADPVVSEPVIVEPAPAEIPVVSESTPESEPVVIEPVPELAPVSSPKSPLPSFSSSSDLPPTDPLPEPGGDNKFGGCFIQSLR